MAIGAGWSSWPPFACRSAVRPGASCKGTRGIGFCNRRRAEGLRQPRLAAYKYLEACRVWEAECGGGEINMKAILAIAASIWMALTLSACGSPGPQELIIGKWKAGKEGIKVEAEFARDGRANLTMFGQTLQGRYQSNGEELEWTVNGRTTKNKAKVTATELEITGGDGMTIIYVRE